MNPHYENIGFFQFLTEFKEGVQNDRKMKLKTKMIFIEYNLGQFFSFPFLVTAWGNRFLCHLVRYEVAVGGGWREG